MRQFGDAFTCTSQSLQHGSSEQFLCGLHHQQAEASMNIAQWENLSKGIAAKKAVHICIDK